MVGFTSLQLLTSTQSVLWLCFCNFSFAPGVWCFQTEGNQSWPQYLPNCSSSGVLEYIKTSPLPVISMFGKLYLKLNSSDTDELCQWVYNTREKLQDNPVCCTNFGRYHMGTQAAYASVPMYIYDVHYIFMHLSYRPSDYCKVSSCTRKRRDQTVLVEFKRKHQIAERWVRSK